ncbi:hypothetical protein [Curtobacterium sp. BRB10]|uniref:hypothetical protein n=1 Tax=Curtobacterium sp. BRB10 TaxID=2962579 RepID=UPI002881911A|nr:hypothetical protein [Curtobacterium sp. BRB10]MDT0234874.1 hypothetical protein [Curtobacterium sp. BRB10]
MTTRFFIRQSAPDGVTEAAPTIRRIPFVDTSMLRPTRRVRTGKSAVMAYLAASTAQPNHFVLGSGTHSQLTEGITTDD